MMTITKHKEHTWKKLKKRNGISRDLFDPISMAIFQEGCNEMIPFGKRKSEKKYPKPYPLPYPFQLPYILYIHFMINVIRTPKKKKKKKRENSK